MNLLQFIEQSRVILKEKNTYLEKNVIEISDFINNEVLSRIDSINNNFILQSRVKKEKSLSEKIIRKNYYTVYQKDPVKFIDSLPDLIGFRIVCFLKQDEKRIDQKLKKIFSEIYNDEFNSLFEDDEKSQIIIKFKEKPDKQMNGHEIYKYECKWIDKSTERTINMEIQVKSLIHMFWGEMEHMLIYKNYDYLVDKDFYSSIMNHNYNLLENIDGQLLAISNHLDQGKREKEKDLKEMLAKIFFGSYQSKIEDGLNTKIDLRLVYDILVKIILKNKEATEILTITKNYLGKEESFNINLNSLMEFETYQIELHSISLTNVNTDFVKEMHNLMINGNVKWRIFYLLYSHLESETNYTKNLANISNLVIESFTQKSLENIQSNHEFFKNSIYKALSIALTHYEEIIFLTQDKLILDILEEILMSNEELEDLESNADLIEYFSIYIASKILLELEAKISFEELYKLHNLMGRIVVWTPNDIDLDSLTDIVSDKYMDTERFKSIFKIQS